VTDKQEWNIAKSNQTCQLCEAKFGVGASYFSAIFVRAEGFERRDFCLSCFQDRRPENVYSYWKTAVPDAEEEDARPKVDLDSVLDFFRRLDGDADAKRIAFRYVLALMLTRKKVFKLDGSEKREDGSEVLVFAARKGGEKHAVVQPDIDENEIGAVSEELGQLLGIAPPPEKKAPEDGDEADGETAEAADASEDDAAAADGSPATAAGISTAEAGVTG